MAVVKKLICCLFVLAAAGESSAGVCKAKTTTPMPNVVDSPMCSDLYVVQVADKVSSLSDARDFCSLKGYKLLTLNVGTFDLLKTAIKKLIQEDSGASSTRVPDSLYIDANIVYNGGSYYVKSPGSSTWQTDTPDTYNMFLLENDFMYQNNVPQQGLQPLYFGYPAGTRSPTSPNYLAEPVFYTEGDDTVDGEGNAYVCCIP